jgi:hypothetical protein
MSHSHHHINIDKYKNVENLAHSSENWRNVNSNMLSLILSLHQRSRYLEAQPNPTQPIHGDFFANLCWRIANEEQSLMFPFKQAIPAIMITYLIKVAHPWEIVLCLDP